MSMAEYRLSDDVEQALEVYKDEIDSDGFKDIGETPPPRRRLSSWLDPLEEDDDRREDKGKKKKKSSKQKKKRKYMLQENTENDGSGMNVSSTELDEAVRRTAENLKDCEEDMKIWKEQRDEIKENGQRIHAEIDARKQLLHDMVDQWAKDLHSQVPAHIDTNVNEASNRINALKDVMKEMQKVCEKSAKDSKKHGAEVVIEKCNELQVKFDENCQPPAIWNPLVLGIEKVENDVIKKNFGRLDGGTTRVEDSAQDASPVAMLDEVDVLLSFNCHTPKDSRECGITDIVTTQQGDFIVVDKHNKLVKVYSSAADFKAFIGRKLLKEPSRACALSTNKHVLISDSKEKKLMVFQLENFTYFGDFATDLKYPICVREMSNSDIAVLDYATKSVVIFDSRWKQTNAVDTELECPAYIAVSLSDRIIVSDWKKHVLRVFSNQGVLLGDIWQLSGPDQRLNGPQGVCVDMNTGHLVVAEKGGRRIVVVTEKGQFLKAYSSPFKIPWSVVSLKDGNIGVADYSGNVKVIRYTVPQGRRESRRSRASQGSVHSPRRG